MSADVVVVNHHLFFADLAVRDCGLAELLPSVRVAIFDEAHQLNEIGVQFLGLTLTTGQLLDLARDILATGLRLAKGLADWQQLAGDCEAAVRRLRLAAGNHLPATKLRWTGPGPDAVAADGWVAALSELRSALEQCRQVLDTFSEIGADFVRLFERAAEGLEKLQNFSKAVLPGHVRWLEVGSQLRLIESPLDIAKAVQTKMLDAPGCDEKSWIFTSATLGDDERLTWFTHSCGLAEADVLRVGSPFDYAQQAAVYIPSKFVSPSDPAHSPAVAQAAARWAQRLQGRTLVLTTTLRALRVIGSELRAALSPAGALDVLVQGEMPKRMLVERFRQGGEAGQRGCIMVASASFWEGLDVPGDALQLVVIDKLPFPPPNDPMVEARSIALEAEGLRAFNGYFLPAAAVALKQGAGRLIRRETDQGVLVVCDTRLVSQGYGKRLMKALPPMKRLDSEAELERRLDDLTKTCTRDCLPL